MFVFFKDNWWTLLFFFGGEIKTKLKPNGYNIAVSAFINKHYTWLIRNYNFGYYTNLVLSIGGNEYIYWWWSFINDYVNSE